MTETNAPRTITEAEARAERAAREERERIEREQREAKIREEQEAAKRERDRKHKEAIQKEAIEALSMVIPVEHAVNAIKLIAQKKVPGVRIEY